jgi:hypothetical protein
VPEKWRGFDEIALVMGLDLLAFAWYKERTFQCKRRKSYYAYP